jgi:hypothetical protein
MGFDTNLHEMDTNLGVKLLFEWQTNLGFIAQRGFVPGGPDLLT